MLHKLKHDVKAEVFDASVASALLLGAVAVFCMLLTANSIIDFGIWVLLVQQPSLPPDIWANAIVLALAVFFMLALDARSAMEMFGMRRLTGKQPPNIIVTFFGLGSWERTISIITVMVNWLTAHGVVFAGLKVGLMQPLGSRSIEMTWKTLVEVVSGDLLLNPFIRTCTWESVYGMTCGHYLATFFALSVAHRVSFDAWRLAPKAFFYYGGLCMIMALAGVFRVQHCADGLWMVSINVITLGLAYSQWHTVHSPAQKSQFSKNSDIESSFSVSSCWFILTMAFSFTFAHFSRTVYPIHLVFTYALHIKSHPMKRGWTITHQVFHCLVHSYRTLDDLPFLWIDKLTHVLFAVVVLQQFCGKRELLSRDPLVKAFSYTARLYKPGDIEVLYRAGFYGSTRRKMRWLTGWYVSALSGRPQANGVGLRNL